MRPSAEPRCAAVPTAALGIALCLLLCACTSSPDGPIQRIPSRQANQMNAEHSRFEASEDPPFRAETHFAAGQLAESQDRMDMAAQQYRAALKINPDHQPSLFRLGVVSALLRNYTESVAVWKEYVRVTNGDPTGLSNLGFAHEIAGQTQEAEAAYRKGLARDPKNKACRVNYGLMLARNGRINEATAQLHHALPPAEVCYNLASVFELQGRKEQARSEYRKALQIDPALTDAATRLRALEPHP